jgi:translation initiation factor 2 beta subunit (eIF-2beta)/eIF-5
MMDAPFDDLFRAYANELRQSKEAAEAWWQDLMREASTNGSVKGLSLQQRWPFGPASHPWVIHTYRKYYFLCKELNRELEDTQSRIDLLPASTGENWGKETPEPVAGVEPRVFVLDLLAGGKTNDLYKFLRSLVYVPIGIKNNDTV